MPKRAAAVRKMNLRKWGAIRQCRLELAHITKSRLKIYFHYGQDGNEIGESWSEFPRTKRLRDIAGKFKRTKKSRISATLPLL